MRGIRIGSIFGVELTIDWSWFIILFLLVWSFSGALFPLNYPGLGPPVYLAMGVVAAFLFFASLVAHELAHSLIARRRGVPVQGITLFVFGGAARVRQEPTRPRDEAWIAGVGPLTSLALALVFALVAQLSAASRWGMAITGVARILASLNVMLALFNLLPGLPLDGGRLLRAAVWAATHDQERATRVASLAGQFIGLLLAGLGIGLVFLGNLVGGLWLLFIGLLVRGMAVAAREQQHISKTMRQTTAAEVMSPHPETVTPIMTLHELVDDRFRHSKHLGFPVVSDGHPLGMITFDEVKSVPRDQWASRTVAQTMVPADQISVRADESVDQVMDTLERANNRRVLVVENGHLAGIITTADVAGWLDHERKLQRLQSGRPG